MSASLKTAVYLPNYGPFDDARIIADLARDAESARWDGFFLWDHVAEFDEAGNPVPCADLWLALTAAAMQTNIDHAGYDCYPSATPPSAKVGPRNRHA